MNSEELKNTNMFLHVTYWTQWLHW